MADRLLFNIAGVNIQVTSFSSRLPLSEDFKLPYRSFLSSWNGPVVSDIAVDVMVKGGQDVRGIPKIFDSGQSWSMHRRGNTYYIAYNSPSAERPFWIAKSNEDFSKITFYCDPVITGHEQEAGIIANPVHYPLDQIILMYYLARHNGMLIHASGIEIKQKGYLFAGRSGAGKTTIAMQFLARHYEGLLSDDRLILREIDRAFRVFGTPWPGKGGIARNMNIPLAGIFFLRHSSHNRVEQVDTRTALEELLPVASIPWYDPGRMNDILQTCERLIENVPAYMLSFRPDAEVVTVVEEFLRTKK
jgi:hypothetical protein